MKRLWPILFLLLGCAHDPARSGANPVPASGLLGTIPFTLQDNRILVNVYLDGQGPFAMIFDVGSENILTPQAQKVLDLKSQGVDPEAKAINGKIPSSVRLNTVRVGDYDMNGQRFSVVNLSIIQQTFHFPHLDGILGAQLLQKARVRVDFDRQQVQLYSASAPPLPGSQQLKFSWMIDKPLIEGRINDRAANILIDTGDRSNLTLFRKFADGSNLTKLFDNRDRVVTGMGLGGPILGKIASLQKIEIGKAEINDVLARLPMTKGGYFYSSRISASVGVGFLKSFNLEIDGQKHLIALQPRRDFKETSTFVPIPSQHL